MVAKNDITGDLIKTKALSKEDQKKFDEGYERIFNKKPTKQLNLPLEEYPENNQEY